MAKGEDVPAGTAGGRTQALPWKDHSHTLECGEGGGGGRKTGEEGGRVGIGVMTWKLNGKDGLHPPCYYSQRDPA